MRLRQLTAPFTVFWRGSYTQPRLCQTRNPPNLHVNLEDMCITAFIHNHELKVSICLQTHIFTTIPQFVEFTHASQLTVRSNLERVSSKMRLSGPNLSALASGESVETEDWKYVKTGSFVGSKVCTFSLLCREISWTQMIQIPMKLNCLESDKKT